MSDLAALFAEMKGSQYAISHKYTATCKPTNDTVNAQTGVTVRIKNIHPITFSVATYLSTST